MLSPSQLDSFQIILVSPRNPLNIGAAARAMANFGFTRLTVVAPFEPHWQEARSAIGAEELLQNARRTDSLAEAIADCTLVIGTGTLTYRKPEQPVVALPDLVTYIQSESAHGAIALVFGPEKHGLTREDLSCCHLLAQIPTDPRQPSMNLGQAVAVCLYELSTRAFQPLDAKPSSDLPAAAATAGRLELLAGVVDQVMTVADYSPVSMREANRHDLRLLLRRLGPTEKDARRILGLLRRVLWRLQH